MMTDHADLVIGAVPLWPSLTPNREPQETGSDASVYEDFATDTYSLHYRSSYSPVPFWKGLALRDDCPTGVLVVHGGWPTHALISDHFNDEEISPQTEMLPNPEEVSAVIAQLETDDLREFAASVMNAAVDSARMGHVDLDRIRLLNGWFASMEETVAAGDYLEEILSRRYTRRGPAQ